MTSRTLVANRSSLLARSPSSTDLGGGKDQHLDVGAGYNGYTFRSVFDFPAIDWSAISAVSSAALRLWVSSGKHAQKLSGSDLELRRVTEQWSPNSSSSSADTNGGSGWSTSGAVYPGPNSHAGEVPVRTNVSTSDGALVSIDVTAIVRAWAPTRVPGGGAQAQYGILLVAASGGMEFRSAETSSEPELVIAYTSDPPNTPTVTAPTGKSTDTTPTFVATATHPQGAPIGKWDLETRPAGGALDYTRYENGSGIGASTVTHTPTTALPAGPREVRVRVFGGGLWSAWSAWAAYAIDRAPAFGSWSAPAASVSGTRRPVHTFTASDADGDALELYDLEVYAAEAGAPVGSAAYVKTSQTAGISGGSVSHTPTADLPGGDLVARARVRAAGVWSAWGPYRAYTIVLTSPAISWISPTSDGGYCDPQAADLADPAIAIGAVRFRAEWYVKPPGGQTITTARIKATRLDGPGAPAIIYDSAITPAADGRCAVALSIAGWAGALYGMVALEATATASGGGSLVSTRVGRWAWAEWFGSAALGDSASGLGAIETPKGDTVNVLYRAQTSPTAAAGAAPWRALAAIATVSGELPATNAYLGLRLRMARKTEEGDLLGGIGSFEDAALAGWTVSRPDIVKSESNSNAIDGTRALVIRGDGAVNTPSAGSARIPVIPGATYRVVGYGRRGSGTVNARVRLDAYGPTGVLVTAGAVQFDFTTTAMALGTGTYTIPTDGSIATLALLCYAAASPMPAATSCILDAVQLVGPAVGDGGMDRLEIAWSSLG